MITHRLPVDGGHVLHVEEHGHPAGIPALVLHGGPGSGTSPVLRRAFDPARYRLVCPDQRGAGLSTPAGSIAANTLSHLLADLRSLRAHLKIQRWLVVGGSWGATLALLHALDEPQAVSGLLLRNVFLARAGDIDAFFRAAGCGTLDHLARVFAEGTAAGQRAAAFCWSQAEQRLAGHAPVPPRGDAALARLIQRYRVQTHYLRNRCWLADPPLLDRCAQLPDVPTLLLHGTEDAICPPQGAAALAQVLGPRAVLRWVNGAGHDPTHPAMHEALAEALRQFAGARTFAA